MEPSFYDEVIMPSSSSSDNTMYDKGKLKLDFSASGTKRQSSMEGSVLTSPDLYSLKLGSPELEKLIMAQFGGILTTPTPTQLFKGSQSVTEQQELYAQGFIEALQRLQEKEGASMLSSQPALQSIPCQSVPGSSNLSFVTANGTNSLTNTNTTSVLPAACSTTISTQSLPPESIRTGANQIFPDFQSASGMVVDLSATSYSQASEGPTQAHQRVEGIKIEEQSQVVPGTPPLPPIDLALQETVKNERKKQRNRLAASKCRKRKLEKEADLQEKVNDLKVINSKLHKEAINLRQQVCELKLQVMKHVHGGCEIMLSTQHQGLTVATSA